MPVSATRPETIRLAPDLEISRILVGLWQVADMERDGRALDLDKAASALADYARAGFTTFDMADHYGSAELITGRCLKRLANDRNRPVDLSFGPTPLPPSSACATILSRLRFDSASVRPSGAMSRS